MASQESTESRTGVLDDATRGQIEDDGQVTPAMLQPTGSDITGPDAVQASRPKTTPQSVGRNRQIVAAVGGDEEGPTSSRAEAGGTHQTRHAFAAHRNAALAQ